MNPIREERFVQHAIEHRPKLRLRLLGRHVCDEPRNSDHQAASCEGIGRSDMRAPYTLAIVAAIGPHEYLLSAHASIPARARSRSTYSVDEKYILSVSARCSASRARQTNPVWPDTTSSLILPTSVTITGVPNR